MLEKPPSTAPALVQPEPPRNKTPNNKPEPTVLYRYQKPITMDNLKHPNDKYRDLIYRPRFLTSKSLEPPTDILVPKFEQDDDGDYLAPLINFRPRFSGREGLVMANKKPPRLLDDLKLPVEKKVEREDVFYN